ncbi:MAG: GGDEF domain-containing protein [Epsilonproteobacteria bacterium]|nr:GGDEF domain-containing protein [Campylobacterota bacterium]
MNEYSSLKKRFLKHETTQIFIRIAFVLSFVAILYYLYFNGGDAWNTLREEPFLSYMIAPAFVVFANIGYYFFIQKYPYRYQKERLVGAIFIDTFMTTYVMYLIGSMSAYYAGVFLWFSVAYGVRYGKDIGYVAYAAVLFGWMILINISPFWIEERVVAMGWLITLIVLPLYNFKLLEVLHENMEKLHALADESKHMATHDRLTDLKNRYAFDEDLRHFVDNYYNNGEKFALFFIDLDSFKGINDKYGHDIGDRVLKEAAKRIQQVIKDAYRLGGDEFVAIAKYTNHEELRNLAKNLLFTVTLPCKNGEIFLGASIGISRYPDDGESEFEIKKRADEAMYQAKQNGKNRYFFYSKVA